ncbi:NADH-quinone oxidoreductase subunit D [uncultured Bacteroides sp.]|uniref:NADH-quinone oxidoreductase subunit D n=1 Tax=uncultured Bacteroides sp. TaxID=162156 RepID=UPI00262F9F3E|nr:NADH-quinone oxidoreductase subunit D [uncultured Bacteroides sp.]
MDNIRFIEPAALHDEMLRLYRDEQMDFLKCLTGMDWGEADENDPTRPYGLGVVYHLESTATGKCTAVRTSTPDRNTPELPTISDIWKAADFLEREVYDFYGIVFIGHPDMRRLYLRNDWVGHPMRKDNDPEKDNPLRMDNEETIDTTTELELNPDGTVKNKELVLFGDEEYVVNIGPQHPATHGVMRFRVSLEGENIKKIDANCGYIHRGIEKMCESLTYPQTLALTDRLDYLGAHQNRHALCSCIEQAMGIEVSDRVKYIRTIMDELQRIDSHLLFFSCLAMDLGALTAFFYGFRDREKILDIFEETCGGRLIMNYNTIGGVQADLHPNFQKRVKEFIAYLRGIIHEYHQVFTGNIIAQQRMKGVGVLSREDAIAFGATGGTGRASGWACDVRKRHPYGVYDKVDFKEIIYTEGDSWARYMVRMDEIMESMNIIEQLIDNIPEGPYQEKMKPIIRVPEGQYYTSVEGSRGEFGVFLESHGDKTPYRLHFRSTGLPLVSTVDTICRGAKIADLIAIGGTLDYVVPDIDR